MTQSINKSHLVSTIADSLSDDALMASLESLIADYKKQKNIRSIPLNLFSNRKLGVLEVVVKYLKENHDLSYHEIAVLLKRDDRTIWTTYNKAIKKYKDKFSAKNEDALDITIFSDRKNSPLGSLVHYLKNKGMNLKQIARELNRDYKTIWSTYKKNEI